jgi:hypothetical protein
LQAAAMMWPTPDTRNGQNGATMRKAAHGRHAMSLHHAVAMWPTPRAADSKGCGPAGSASAEHMRMKGQLSGAVLYPTPRAQSATGASHAPNRQGGADLQTVVQSESKDNGQLNPTWVEWLMGFPIGWTDLNA